MQQENISEEVIKFPKRIKKNWVRIRSNDGITTYMVFGKNGQMVDMEMIKEPWAETPEPMCSPDTGIILATLKRKKGIEKRKIIKAKQEIPFSPLPEIPNLLETEEKNEKIVLASSSRYTTGDGEIGWYVGSASKKLQIHEKLNTHIGKGALKEKGINKEVELYPHIYKNDHQNKPLHQESTPTRSDASFTDVKADKKTNGFLVSFLSKILPNFVLKRMKLNKGGGAKFEIPIQIFDKNIKFNLYLQRERGFLTNESERIIMGLFTISFGGKKKKINNLAVNAGPFYRAKIEPPKSHQFSINKKRKDSDSAYMVSIPDDPL